MSVKIVILCEDKQFNTFIRRFLKSKHRLHSRDITSKIAPDKGSGEQWVRENYENELKAVRGRANAILVVGTDADTKTAAARKETLDNQCSPNPGDRVIFVIPERNIETWIYFLDPNLTYQDTTVQHRHLAKERDCKNALKVLLDMCNKNTQPRGTPQSLMDACQDYANWKNWI